MVVYRANYRKMAHILFTDVISVIYEKGVFLQKTEYLIFWEITQNSMGQEGLNFQGIILGLWTERNPDFGCSSKVTEILFFVILFSQCLISHNTVKGLEDMVAQ